MITSNKITTATAAEKRQFLPDFEGEFTSFTQWVSKAPTWITKDAVCVDTKGRICRLGKDFMRARDENAFPVRFFYALNPVAEPTPAFEQKIEDTDSARRYLLDFMDTHFTDKTFGHYIENDLAGDYAYHLARSIGETVAENAGRSDVVAEAQQLREENDRLRTLLSQKLTESTLLTGMEVAGNSLNLELEGGAARLLAESFAGQFREHGGENYLELRFTAQDGLNLLVTLQKVEGKTPSQLRKEAEAALTLTKARLAELETARDEQPVNAARYRFVRTLTARQFAEIFEENLRTGTPLDDIIDARRAQYQETFEVKAPALTQRGDALKTQPAIGTPGWFACIPPAQRADAETLVRKKVPVIVQHRNETGEPLWAVMFQNTDFWAEAFSTKEDAEPFAKNWNDQCASK